MRRGGATYKAIADELGVSRPRVRQLVISAAREAIRKKPDAKEQILDSIYIYEPEVRAQFHADRGRAPKSVPPANRAWRSGQNGSLAHRS
jgi:hypothetical protein